MTLEIDLLGRFAVRRAGRRLQGPDFGGQLSQRLIRMLAVRRGEVVPRDALIEALWSERPPADPEANLNVVVNRARRGLGDPEAIETVASGYLLGAGADIIVDVERFELAVRAARQQSADGQPARALQRVTSALAMWRSEPLPDDAYADWAQPHRRRLARVHQEALEIGAAAALAVGDLPRAGDLAAEAVSRQPLREAANVLQIRTLAAAGDPAAALAAYETLRRRLADELGIDPAREAVELHLGLLRGDPAATSAPLPTAGPAPGSAAGGPTAAPPLVGRERELARLADLGTGARLGVVRGTSGSGKSRLLREVAVGTDRLVLAARAVLPEREAPWSLARILLRAVIEAGADPGAALPRRSTAALSDLLPELADGDTGTALDPQSRRALALEAAARLIAAAGPALVVVDDLQWADASSLDLLSLVASRAEHVTIVLSYRPEEVGPDHQVASFLTDLYGSITPVEIRLGPLTPDALQMLVTDAEVAAVLAHATDGTPFAVLEVIRSLEQRGLLRRDGAVWRPTGPQVRDEARAAARAGLRSSLIARADRQPGPHRELLSMLALLGRPAPAALLAEAAGTTPTEVASHLDRLARAELVRHDQHGWAMAHDLVGEALRDRLDAVERARLHQQLARAMESEPDAAGERAHHLAGAGDRPAAAAAFAAAARQRLDRFADREADLLAQAGLDLEPPAPLRARLLEVRAQTRHRTGDLSGTRDDLRAALALTETPSDRSRLLARLAELASGAEDLQRASNLVDLALAEAGDDPSPRARALVTGAIIDMNLQRPERAETRYAEALSLFERISDARGVADILDARAMATFLDGDITAAIAAFDRVARMFADAGDLLRVVTPRSTRGHALVFAGKPQDGLADSEDALELARSLGSPEGQSYALWHRSEALAACGDPEEATAVASEALAIAEQLGHRGWTATALRAQGIARRARGDLAGAEQVLRRCMDTSEHLPLFACWARAQLAMVLVSIGHLDEAAGQISQALATGPPLGHYEARLAHCELAVARAEPTAAGLITVAAGHAERGGHHASLARLSELASQVIG